MSLMETKNTWLVDYTGSKPGSQTGRKHLTALLTSSMQPNFLKRSILLSFGLLLFVQLSCHSSIAADSVPHLQKSLSLADARHLLSRTGFGAQPQQMLKLTGLSRAQAIDNIVSNVRTKTHHPMPEWVSDAAPRFGLRRDMSRKHRRAFNRERDREIAELRQWWVREMLESPSPQTERLVLFWHNHFVSSYASLGEQSTSIARQNRLFRRYAIANYRTFLKQIIRDPAMLAYLNNRSNRKKSPNENLARELMELFTLGEGKYSEQDVKNAARALTGYTVEPLHNMQFGFNHQQHDKKPKILFGETGNFDGDDLIDIILKQSRAAEFLTEKFWKNYIDDSSDHSKEQQAIADAFRESDYEIIVLYRLILQSKAFWHPQSRAALIKSPVDLVLGTIRSTGKVPTAWQSLPAVLARQGQKLFEAPDVAGWPGGVAWITTDRLLSRIEWLAAFEHSHCAGLHCLESNSELNSAMAEKNSMSSMAVATDNVMAAPKLIYLRLAAEAFNGAPNYQISLSLKNKTVWESDSLSVSSSHDTQRFGRVIELQNLPWITETVELNLPLNTLPAFDAVSLKFLNDRAASSGDRNLYVDWINVDGELFMASEGEQVSECPPRQADMAGSLYCDGSVTIKRQAQNHSGSAGESVQRSNVSPTTAEILDPQLRVGHASLAWVNDPDRLNPRWSDIGFELHDVEFRDREIYTLSVRLAKNQKGGLGLWMDTNGCWPDCLTEWPKCARISDYNPLIREARFELDEMLGAETAVKKNYSGRCAANELQKEDREFLEALWFTLPDLYTALANSPRLQQPHKATVYTRWKKQFDRVASANRVRQKADPRLVAVQLLLRNQGVLDVPVNFSSMAMSSKGGVAEAPLLTLADKTASALTEVLVRMEAKAPLASLLLATQPVGSGRDEQSFSAVITDPAYQLK